jgi:hypothetical protein
MTIPEGYTLKSMDEIRINGEIIPQQYCEKAAFGQLFFCDDETVYLPITIPSFWMDL